ncbi:MULTISPECIES: DUF4127 family protein [Pseudothermotoga]|uniref:DUF4127 domain-containing protein n=1 Tax=Pseudothermotoga lettingae (strain ATCC BAA-301 / DSM 14385 / NBRC 107922 / TMO) TaxID=416591 RepID=A8F3E1_PSELT|nr:MULTISPECIES: DUF4127 family protein [Pseudothermotoga]MDN5338614.1 hypothetical protein [Thermotogaceae bacterium]ABV32675.1 conserved hypothetical protein [Pseudothermotoga lettingae TMO]KUK21741.1 MAG: Uncharacterized protein XD56_0321 [Pseudothermotoga lettingae]MDK2885285.1 hypothetical protein [Pseudothermotoga sp.]GLI48332.1 hypothetical protein PLETTINGATMO_05010 [Pseudothermotoga lettingae TMO]
MRIIFLPVDNRFCTKDYFMLLSKAFNFDVLCPEDLGCKKIPADTEYISHWLLANAREGDLLILSLDMLLHGGLVPSRIDRLQIETLLGKLEILEKLKKIGTKIYASRSITRIPTYNSDEEEPDYWMYYGEKLYRYSLSLSNGDKRNFSDIPGWVIEDFLWRRKRNLSVSKEIINLVKNGVIDYLSLMMDDNSEGSLVAKEAKELNDFVERSGLSKKVSIRNGTDEISLVLLSRALCDHFDIRPRFTVKYTFPDCKNLIPPYESSPLEASVQSHISGSGGVLSDSEADILLYVNNFNEYEKIREAPFQEKTRSTISNQTFDMQKVLGLADVRFANGSDRAFVENLLDMKIDWTRACYYGWNTAGNTIGSTCAHTIFLYLSHKKLININEDEIKRYQAILILEHYGYQSDIRQRLVEFVRQKNSCSYFLPDENWAVNFVEREIQEYVEKLNKVFKRSWKASVYFPWHRTFEIGIVLNETR